MKRAHRLSIYPDLSPEQCEALLPGAHWQDDLEAEDGDYLYVGPAVAKQVKESLALRVTVWPDNYDLKCEQVETTPATGGDYTRGRRFADLGLHRLLRYLCYGSPWPRAN
ncbi:unnamed protein product, partial [marine sediment metagenome]